MAIVGWRKLAACAALAVAALAAMLAAEGAGASYEALRRIEVSLSVEDPSTAREVRALAIRRLEQSWARPLLWHPAAMEAKGWAALIEPSASREAGYAQSAEWTARALNGSPIHAAGWFRLALVAAYAPTPCGDADACLEASFAASPMAVRARDLACLRLRFATLSGAVTTAADPRVQAFLQDPETYGRRLEGAHACLIGLPIGDVARAISAIEREKSSKARPRG